jgi:hypothetical protein
VGLSFLRSCFSIDDGVLSTLKVFRNGEPSEYTGPRKADGIISYMIKYVVTVLSFESPIHFSPPDNPFPPSLKLPPPI